jgi:RNA polymerase sigma factor (sigma-70 family)
VASQAATAESLDEERRLVEEAQRGNLDAMRPIFERYATPLYATVILPRVGNTAAAEDVLRDTMAAAIEKLDKFTWQGRSIYTWLRQIAVNKAYDVHRKSKRNQRLVDAMANQVPSETLPDQRADARLIVEEERRSNHDRIATTLDKISDRYRRAIQLRLIDELPRSECADKMDVTTGTFDVLLFRAVRAFRKQFGSRD